MANTKQSAKRARQNIRRRLRGQAIRSRCRTLVKKARLAAGKDAKEFQVAYLDMQSTLDRAAGKKLLPRNAVARLKRRITRLGRSAAPAATADA